MNLRVDAPPSPPDHTRRYLSLTKEDLDPGATILFSMDATEQRARLPLWQDMCATTPERCIVIERQEKEHVTVRCRGATAKDVSLLDDASLAELLFGDSIYLDISGLAHHVWAPLLRVAYQKRSTLKVVYIEPANYRPHPSPASSTAFDLSSAFGGLAPLPGFTRLSGPADETKTLFVAMLGFEGNRPERLALQMDSVERVIPVIGVPGFRLEYPAFTVACNRSFLEEYRAHGDIRYARASCPFEAFDTLAELQRDYPDHYMYIAPVGTKPHSLGAVWFALENPTVTELMYDHPVRKPGRTQGLGLTHIYDLHFTSHAGS